MVNLLSFLALFMMLLQTQALPKVRHINVMTEHETEIVFRYALPVFIDSEPIKEGAIECFVTNLKGTGLFTDVQVRLKPSKNGEWVDVVIYPIWNNLRESFVIGELVFEDFGDINIDRLKEQLRQEGLRHGIPLLKFTLRDIGHMIDNAVRKLYGSEDDKLDQLSDMNLANPRFDLRVIESNMVRLTVSLKRKNPCILNPVQHR